MLPNELLWIFEIHISGNNVYLICKQEAILWAGDESWSGGVSSLSGVTVLSSRKLSEMFVDKNQ